MDKTKSWLRKVCWEAEEKVGIENRKFVVFLT